MYVIAGATHKGTAKPLNEDHILINGKILNEGYIEITASRLMAVVCDGVSGEQGGQIASRMALEAFMAKKDSPITSKTIFECFKDAHTSLRQEKKYPYMATTAVGVFMDDDNSIVFNMGDSKAYLFKFGALRQLSLDHTTSSELSRQGIENNVNPHQISRFIGGRDSLSNPEVKENVGKINGTNNLLLLCSDGLTDFVKIEYIEKVLVSERTLIDKAKTLVALANKFKTTDNVSVILVCWKEDTINE